jgi:cytochrome b
MNSATAAPAPAPGRRVVDAPTRAFHWLFALCFVGAYLSAEGERLRLLHITLGYTLAGLLVFRVLYGLVGPRHARLSLMWRKLAGLLPWLQSLRATAMGGTALARPPVNWRQGQNLLMAGAVVALLLLTVPLTLSGYGTYNDWGDVLGGDWLEEVHELVGNAFLAVVLVHVGLIAVLSLLRRKNAASPMLTGHTPGPGPDLVKRNHAWLAGLLLVAVVSFWTWQWQQSPTPATPGEALRALGSTLTDAHDD